MRIGSLTPKTTNASAKIRVPLKGIRWGLIWRALCPWQKNLVLNLKDTRIVYKGEN